jgi:hypothetical protein
MQARPPPLSPTPVTGLNARDFGAVGDGQTDDTAALQAALDAAAKIQGTVFVPEGTFMTGRLRLHAHTGIIGQATWSYQEPGGSILKLNDASAICLLDLTGARGATVNGLSLQGGNLGTRSHGIFMGEFPEKKQEDAPRIERCHISRFTGDGIRLDPVWCFSIRSCEVIFNQGNALSLRGWDGFVLDNWFSGNGGAGFASIGPNASNTLTGNRIEWNRGGGIVILGGSHYNITGNYIDRSGGPAIRLAKRDGAPCLCITATGNVIYRSGKPEWTSSDPLESCHARLEDAHGLVFTGNSFCVGQDDGKGVNSPQFGLVLRGLVNTVVTNNTLHIGAISELIHDLGEHGEGVIIKDNPGCLLLTPEKPIWLAPQR